MVHWKFILLAILFSFSKCRNYTSSYAQHLSCFDKPNLECRDSIVKIFENYYECDLVKELDIIPKKIISENGYLYVASGSNTFIISEIDPLLEKVKKTLHAVDGIYDNKQNKYYLEDGAVFVTDATNQQDIEIITNGHQSSSQLALDANTNILFVLSTNYEIHTSDRKGSLYSVKIDPLKFDENGEIRAEKVEDIDENITAFAVDAARGKIVLGLKKDNKGKVVRLKRLSNNPCIVADSNTNVNKIFEVMNRTSEDLIKIFSEIRNKKSINAIPKDGNKNLNLIQTENKKLKKDLELVQKKLEAIMTRVTEKKMNKDEDVSEMKIVSNVNENCIECN